MTYFDLEAIERRELLPGLHVRFVHCMNMTIAYWDIEANAEMPLHSHPHEQITNVLEGRLELVVGGESRILGPGSGAVIAPDVPHSGKAIGDCRVLDVFYPVREEYR